MLLLIGKGQRGLISGDRTARTSLPLQYHNSCKLFLKACSPSVAQTRIFWDHTLLTSSMMHPPISHTHANRLQLNLPLFPKHKPKRLEPPLALHVVLDFLIPTYAQIHLPQVRRVLLVDQWRKRRVGEP